MKAWMIKIRLPIQKQQDIMQKVGIISTDKDQKIQIIIL